ncbi:MAG TPA: type II toxin-antitoxin system VapC family toxin [Candidatus Fraserbacteria bacterium]|nr:type II toxin-antitoxin system VapC family toxin [Candidatus Fraserbacteria bacterium]
MITSLDTNVLLDLLIPNVRYAQASQQQLDEALALGSLVIGEVVYAELASQFPTPEELDQFLVEAKIHLEPSGREALQQAAQAWKSYLQRRGKGLQCPRCGTEQQASCSHCGEVITVRQHILSDFLVGAHALVQADHLFTRDLGYYRSYFPQLSLL